MERAKAVFGRRLRILRKQAGLTQEQLGKAARINYKWLGAVERSEKAPSFDVMERIAKALNRELYEFFLPDRLATGALEQQTKVIVRKLEKLDRSGVQSFFRDLLIALQRLDRTR